MLANIQKIFKKMKIKSNKTTFKMIINYNNKYNKINYKIIIFRFLNLQDLLPSKVIQSENKIYHIFKKVLSFYFIISDLL